MPTKEFGPPESQTQLDFLEKLLFKWYPQQPKAVRVLTFLVVLYLVSYGVLHVLGGSYVIHGSLVQKLPNGHTQAAKGYEIHPTASEESYGTNFKGTYYVVMSPLQYYAALVAGSMRAQISTEAEYYPEQVVPFHRLEGSLEQVVLDPAPPPTASNAGGKTAEFRQAPFGVAWAASAPASGVRLVIYNLQLPAEAGKFEEASFQLDWNGQSLQAQRATGFAGTLPVSPGQSFRYGRDYFFQPSWRGDGDLLGTIVITSKATGNYQFLATRYSESYPIRVPTQHWGKQTYAGSRGGELTLVACAPIQIVVPRRQDLNVAMATLEDALLAQGLWMTTPPTKNLGGESNAVYAGNSVPVAITQRFLIALAASSASIRYLGLDAEVEIRDPNQIQLASRPNCEAKPRIPPSELQRLGAIADEAEFRREAAVHATCTPPITRTKSIRRK